MLSKRNLPIDILQVWILACSFCFIMKTYLQSFPNMPVPKTYTCSTG
nr:MAG TPA: hypothetical protein [Bacteriophage sp.]